MDCLGSINTSSECAEMATCLAFDQQFLMVTAGSRTFTQMLVSNFLIPWPLLLSGTAELQSLHRSCFRISNNYPRQATIGTFHEPLSVCFGSEAIITQAALRLNSTIHGQPCPPIPGPVPHLLRALHTLEGNTNLRKVILWWTMGRVDLGLPLYFPVASPSP